MQMDIVDFDLPVGPAKGSREDSIITRIDICLHSTKCRAYSAGYSIYMESRYHATQPLGPFPFFILDQSLRYVVSLYDSQRQGPSLPPPLSTRIITHFARVPCLHQQFPSRAVSCSPLPSYRLNLRAALQRGRLRTCHDLSGTVAWQVTVRFCLFV